MRWLSLLILPTLVLPMSLPGGTREDRSAEAQRLVDSKQFPAALKIYRALNASDPDVADYWIRRARLEGWTGAWTDAEASYVRIQEKWPENVEAIVGHVYVAIWQERFGEAERLLESAERLAPEDVGVLAVRVRFFRAQKKAPEAVRALAVLERRYPEHAETSMVRKEVAEMEGRWELSIGNVADQIIPGQIGTGETIALRYSLVRDTLSFRLTQTQRQSESPTQVGMTYTHRAGRNYWISGNFAVAAGAQVTSKGEYGASIARRIFSHESVALSYTHVQFKNAAVETLSPSFEKSFGPRFSAGAAYWRSWIRRPDGVQSSEALSVHARAVVLPKRLTLTTGFSGSTAVTTLATEAGLGVGGDKTVFGGAEIRINARNSITMNGTWRYQGVTTGWLGIGIALVRSW